jgi:hypothetical protein
VGGFFFAEDAPRRQKDEAEVMQVTASEQSVVIAREKGKADAALEEAIPALEMAESALANLHKEDITEVKNFAKPPALVQDACLMVVCLRPTGVKLDENWGDAKKMLADTSLLDKLKRYPKDSITEKMMKSVRKYFKNPKMTVENMKSVSKAGTGLGVPFHAVDATRGHQRGRWVVFGAIRTVSSGYGAPRMTWSPRRRRRGAAPPRRRRRDATSDRVERPRRSAQLRSRHDGAAVESSRRRHRRDPHTRRYRSVSVGHRHLQVLRRGQERRAPRRVDSRRRRASPDSSPGMLEVSRPRCAQVEPLKAKVRDMEKQQAKTTKLLADLNDQLGVLSKELGELDANFKAKNEELTGLQTQAALMEKRLAAASKLITGLTGERTRWTSDIGDLNNSKVQLVGDCLLAASFLSYAGAFTSDFRAGMIYETFAKKVRSRRPVV